MVMYDVREQTPQDSEYHYCYSAIFGSYHIAKYSPAFGWLEVSDKRLSCVTHFWEEPLPMPFEVVNFFDEAKAREYGIDKTILMGYR